MGQTEKAGCDQDMAGLPSTAERPSANLTASDCRKQLFADLLQIAVVDP